eukprot:356690-Chlamydomonas_euryale.AAC.12
MSAFQLGSPTAGINLFQPAAVGIKPHKPPFLLPAHPHAIGRGRKRTKPRVWATSATADVSWVAASERPAMRLRTSLPGATSL